MYRMFRTKRVVFVCWANSHVYFSHLQRLNSFSCLHKTLEHSQKNLFWATWRQPGAQNRDSSVLRHQNNSNLSQKIRGLILCRRRDSKPKMWNSWARQSSAMNRNYWLKWKKYELTCCRSLDCECDPKGSAFFSSWATCRQPIFDRLGGGIITKGHYSETEKSYERVEHYAIAGALAM